MSDKDFKERLARIKAKWEECTSDPDSMTAEAKKQCLEELDDVCKSLGGIREGLAEASKAEREAEEKAKVQITIDGYMDRLKEIHRDMKWAGAKYSCNYSLYGYLPVNWVDRTEHLAKIKDAKKQLEVLEADFERWMPALESCKFDSNGSLVSSAAVLPPVTDFLKGIHGSLRYENHYSSHVVSNINQLNQAIRLKRSELHHLLMSFKMIDLKAVQGNLDKLNKEREQIIYNLRVLEGKGHFTGFNLADYPLE